MAALARAEAGVMSGMIRVRMPALDRLAHALERRALKRLENRARKLGGDPWRSPDRLWPHFGDD
ncbi:hypothetical protein AAJ72_00060 [Citromicrobium sp. RCC1885]|nr:hypothetical protein AAJ72_00060 [Citromicrobium sp. RCC1885]KPM27467.1 hypothetical protein AAJ74_00805 [Citromicrobium sp. RCC1878]OAM11212.1 hypothetical protein A0U43_08600 [Citromicrobium sp. RCC1897]